MTTVLEAPPPTARPRLAGAWRAAALRLVGRRLGGRLAVVEDDGDPQGDPPVVLGDPARAEATVTVHSPALYPAVLRRGSTGLAAGYVAGWWDTDDLVGLLRLVTRHLPGPGSPADRVAAALARLRRGAPAGGRPEDRARDRRDVQAHYDLGDEFFALFLDPTLTYSCAIFERPVTSLEEAQRAKLDRLCRSLGLGPDHEVLEIGSGWGSFAVHAATTYGCRVTTTTVSDRQVEHVRRQVAELGLADRITVRHDDYRDLTGRYDAVVSIEMIEALGWRQLDRFFSVCSERLRPDGALALQAIVIDDRLYERAKRTDDFIKAMVFPGSTIPSVAAIRASVARVTDLRPVATDHIGRHYVETLARWRDRFLDRRGEVAALGFGEPFLRLWDLYLAYCQAGFAEGRIDDVQLLLAKPGWCSPTAGAPR